MINEFLKSRIEDAKTLVQELNETYEYVSILGNYVKTKKALITTVSSSIDELDNECGFVIKVYKDGQYPVQDALKKIFLHCHLSSNA